MKEGSFIDYDGGRAEVFKKLYYIVLSKIENISNLHTAIKDLNTLLRNESTNFYCFFIRKSILMY